MSMILNAKNIEAPWTAWFLYGDSGSGKTEALATFPKPLVILPKNEGSILTLRGRDVDYTEVGTRAEMLAVLTMLETRYNQMLSLPPSATKADLDKYFPWQTIGVESLSHYCELLVEDISQRGHLKMDYSKWGELTGHIRTIHSRLRNLDVHIVYTSLAKQDENGRGQPMMVGKSSAVTPSACDYLGYCEQTGGSARAPATFRVHFNQYGVWPARARQSRALRESGTPAFPSIIEDFSFDKVRPYLGL